MDRNKATFLDVLIECDQKTVVSNAAVSVLLWGKVSHIKMLFVIAGSVLPEWVVERWFELDWQQSQIDPPLLCNGCLSTNLDILFSSTQHKDEQSTICQVHMQNSVSLLFPTSAGTDRYTLKIQRYLTILTLYICVIACIPIDDIQNRTVYIPQWYEWLLLSKDKSIFSRRLCSTILIL